MLKTCPRCGKRFECLEDDIERCACTQVKLTRAALAYIHDTYNDCLCNTCMLQLNRQKDPTE